MSTEVPFDQVTTGRVQEMRAEFGKLPERVPVSPRYAGHRHVGRARVSEEDAEAQHQTWCQDSRVSLTVGRANSGPILLSLKSFGLNTHELETAHWRIITWCKPH